MTIGRGREQNAAVYTRRGKYLLQPYFQATSGVFLGGEPVTVIDSAVSDDELGKALLEALAKSKGGVPHPASWSNVARPEQRAAGVRSWASFVKGALYCSASLTEECLSFIPTKNAGSRGGFEHLNNRKLMLERPLGAGQIGAAVREALSRCE